MSRARLRTWALAACVASGLASIAGASPAARMVTVGPGVYRPLFPATPRDTELAVRPFRLDVRPVTNGDFLAFVRAHPAWRRDRVERVFADERYLERWAGPELLGEGADPDQPVVEVSWFAARAYCAARGGRLPTEAEWELAATASRAQPDGSQDPAWRTEVDALYARPSAARLPRVGESAPNFWGVQDLHGLVWEWVLDYNGALVTSNAGADRLRFCGADGASPARDKLDFAAFERAAFRNSLRAAYTTRNLGFRCAADAEEKSR